MGTIGGIVRILGLKLWGIEGIVGILGLNLRGIGDDWRDCRDTGVDSVRYI